jgi:deglycase
LCTSSPRKPGKFGARRRRTGRLVKVDVTLDEARVQDDDAIVLPGANQPKPFCASTTRLWSSFAPSSPGDGRGCRLSRPLALDRDQHPQGTAGNSYKSIKTDMINAGAKWEDVEVVADQRIVSSRNPGDLEAFSRKIMEEIADGKHERRAA